MSQKTLSGFGFLKSGSVCGVKRTNDSVNTDVDSETELNPKKKFVKNLNQASFDWYVCDERGLWHCSVCREAKSDNIYAHGHERPAKTTNHKRHAESISQKSAVTKQHFKGKFVLPKQVEKIVTQDTEIITTYFKLAYHQAKHELPKAAFKQLVQLSETLDVDLIKDKSSEVLYTSNNSLNEFHECISEVIWQDTYDAIIKSHKYGIMIDESTDIGNKKQLLAYIQYLDQDGVKCALLENMLITTASANADIIVEKITDCLQRKKIDIRNMVGIGTDGASVMTGSKNGVVKKLRDSVPSLVGVHCAAHRCALAASQAANSIPELDSFNRTVSNIFYYFSNSALRSNRLSEIKSLLQLPTLKFANIHSVRWLSLQHAVEVLYRSFPALVITLEHEAISNPVAKGLLKEVVQYKFIGFIHMLMDILPFIGRLSKTFQTNVIDFSKIRPAVSATCDSLEDLLVAEGVYTDKLAEFVTNEDGKSEYKRPVSESKAAIVKDNISENIDGFSGFEQVCDNDYDDEDDIIPESSAQLNGESKIIHCVNLKYADVQKNVLQRINEEYINKVAKNLRNRFDDLDTLEMLSALDPNVIKKNESCLASFGKENILKLGKHFSIDCDKLRSEYVTYKRLVIGSCKDLDLHEVALKIISEHDSMLPNICLCLKICCVIPVSSVACERGFSTQNRIKSKLRTNLNNATLNRLMRISEQGPSPKHFNFSRAVAIWRQKKRKH